MTKNALLACAKAVVRSAAEKSLTLATAESCTAGALTKLLAESPGAGGTFLGGFVCYDKRFKQSVLQVPGEVLQAETAVSERVAEAIAHGASQACGADVAIAVTGVAGPDPDEDGNPVGLVHLMVVCSNGQKRHARLQLGDLGPGLIKSRAVEEGLNLALAALQHWDSREAS
jgi:nicotinamide-nucleotide amidase